MGWGLLSEPLKIKGYIQELQTLAQVSFLRRERVSAMRELISRVRAEANRDFTIVMHERESVNAGYLER